MIDPGPEHGDTLPTGELDIQTVFFGNASQAFQFFRRDFPSGQTWDYGIGTIFLDVGQVGVVGILQLSVPMHRFVPQAGQDRGHSGFADLAAQTHAVFAEQFGEGLDLLFENDGKEFGSGVTEVFTQTGIDLHAVLD